MKPALSLGLAVLIGILIVGCGEDSDGPTGIEIVDTVLAALETGDRAALTPLWRLEDTPCIDPNGAPTEVSPLCREGEEPGTIVRTFAENYCVGLFRERATAEALSDIIMAKELGDLYAVFAAAEDHYLAARYILIFGEQFEAEPPDVVRGYQILLSNDQIVATDSRCGFPPEQLIESFDPADRIPVDE